MTHPNPFRFPDVTYADIAAELLREIAARDRMYPARVAKGSMTQQHSDAQRAVFAALLLDATRFEQAQAAPGYRGVNALNLPAGHAFTWYERRDALQRELQLRARHYPGWVAKGNMSQAQADRQTRRLAALLQLFEDGLDFPGTREDFYPIYLELLKRDAPSAYAVLCPPAQEAMAL